MAGATDAENERAARSLIFPAQEFRARVQRLQTAMARENIDALLLTAPSDIFYVTGFLTRFWESPARPWFLIVPSQGVPIAVIPAIGQALMAQTWISDIRTWQAPNPGDDGISLLYETLTECVSVQGAIGIPMGVETHLRMPLVDYHQLADQLLPRRIVDGTGVLHRTREIKSDAEISKIKEICQIAGRVFAELHEFVHPGQSMASIFRAFQARLLNEGADWVSYVAGAAGKDGYLDVIAPASSKPLKSGDVLMLDTGAVKDGYFCDFDRNFFIGEVSPQAQRTQEALWQATESTLDALQPGMRACDAHQLLSDALLRRGAQPCGGRLGHGLGVTLTEWPSLTPLDKTELRAGMVLTLEPSAYVEGDRFMVHEENIVLRPHRAELLSPRAPRACPVIPTP